MDLALQLAHAAWDILLRPLLQWGAVMYGAVACGALALVGLGFVLRAGSPGAVEATGEPGGYAAAWALVGVALVAAAVGAYVWLQRAVPLH